MILQRGDGEWRPTADGEREPPAGPEEPSPAFQGWGNDKWKMQVPEGRQKLSRECNGEVTPAIRYGAL